MESWSKYCSLIAKSDVHPYAKIVYYCTGNTCIAEPRLAREIGKVDRKLLGMSRAILPGEDGFQQGKMEALNKVVNVDYSQTICVASYKTELTHSRKFVKHKHRESFPDSFPLLKLQCCCVKALLLSTRLLRNRISKRIAKWGTSPCNS